MLRATGHARMVTNKVLHFRWLKNCSRARVFKPFAILMYLKLTLRLLWLSSQLTGDARLEFLRNSRNENGARGPVGYQPTIKPVN